MTKFAEFNEPRMLIQNIILHMKLRM